ncbi:MAG: hypothetical protein HY720_20065 [Planctomycetes bacterium]|nr:hypothetical protein [Planctomycetota bacterium]
MTNRLFITALCATTAACATASRTEPPENYRYGVLVLAHGGSPEWNEAVRDAVRGLEDDDDVEIAFGMADAKTIQEGVRRLEERGVQRIGVVRLFVSGESWYERTEQILGLAPGAPPKPAAEVEDHSQHGAHSMEFWRIETAASFALSTEGLAGEFSMGEILAERASDLSRSPATEDVLILAHGPGDDEENERWLADMEVLAGAVRSARPFRRVEAMTLREDWPEKREVSEQRIRDYVARAKAEGGSAIVVPFRVHGFGPYAAVLEGLDYAADGRGLLPHALVGSWIKRQARTIERGPFREPIQVRGR